VSGLGPFVRKQRREGRHRKLQQRRGKKQRGGPSTTKLSDGDEKGRINLMSDDLNGRKKVKEPTVGGEQ